MKLKTAQWLLSGAQAFQKNKKLQEWEGLSKENFLFILTLILGVKDFSQAVSLLVKVVTGQLVTPSIPPDLATLVENWEKAKEGKEEARQRAAQAVQEFLKEQKVLFPLAGPTKPPSLPVVEKALTPETFPPEEEGVAFVPLYTLLQPKLAVSFLKKIALSPIVKTLQFLDKVAGEELVDKMVSPWREGLHQGLTSQDIDTSLVALTQAGVSPEHPQIQQLEKKRTALRAYEQNHRLVSGILQHYHEFSKITGRRQISVPEIKIFLPRLAQVPVWISKRGYSWRLRQIFNQIGLSLGLYKKVELAPQKTVIQSRISILGRNYQKTVGAVFNWLGKRAIGRGFKKLSAWILTKLGLAAIPTGVTQAVALGLFIRDVIKLGLGFFKGILRRLNEKPLETLLVGLPLLAAGLFLLLPLPLKLFFLGAGLVLSIIGLVAGAVKWIGGAISGIGSFFGGVASTIGGFLSSLGAISVPSTIPMIAAVGAPALVAGLTVVTILNTSAAFAPKEAPGGVPGVVEIGPMPTVAPNPASAYLAEKVVYRLTGECGIERVNRSNLNKVTDCLQKSLLPNKQVIIKNFEESVNNNKSLQCVGFVAAIEQAQGRNFLQNQNARFYWNNPPSDYQQIYNRQEVQPGDLAVWWGVKYGHIAVVTKREGNVKIVVAQAWGDDVGIDGRVNLTETTFDDKSISGFIRAK